MDEEGPEVEIRVQLALPRDARYVGLLRRLSRCVLEDFHVPSEASDDIALALTEACANAIRHATDADDYSVRLVVSEEACEVEVVDLGPGFGPGFAPPQLGAPTIDLDLESGRGLPLMRALVDDLEFRRDGDETRVRLVKRWDATRDGDGVLTGAWSGR